MNKQTSSFTKRNKYKEAKYIKDKFKNEIYTYIYVYNTCLRNAEPKKVVCCAFWPSAPSQCRLSSLKPD